MTPLASELAAHQRLKLELAADRAATQRVGRRPLAEALLALHAGPGLTQPAVAGGGSLLGARVEALLEGAGPPRFMPAGREVVRSLLGVGAVIALLVLVVASPAIMGDPLVPMPMNPSGTGEMAVAWLLRALVVAGAWGAVRLLTRRS
jgi:hypothetical protein